MSRIARCCVVQNGEYRCSGQRRSCSSGDTESQSAAVAPNQSQLTHVHYPQTHTLGTMSQGPSTPFAPLSLHRILWVTLLSSSEPPLSCPVPKPVIQTESLPHGPCYHSFPSSFPPFLPFRLPLLLVHLRVRHRNLAVNSHASRRTLKNDQPPSSCRGLGPEHAAGVPTAHGSPSISSFPSSPSPSSPSGSPCPSPSSSSTGAYRNLPRNSWW